MLRITVALVLFCAPALADPQEDRCISDIALVRELASILPPDDLSRRYAETDLDTAVAELSGGEVDDCDVLTDRARHTLVAHPYELRPGEVLGRRSR